MIPKLEKNGFLTELIVDGKLFPILGAELNNSSASSLEYLETKVWPAFSRLGANTILAPVYWECLEPEQGQYDFTLVNGLIQQAKREKVHLVLLWFGLWKNCLSSYTPAWMKTDPKYIYMKMEDGREYESVSPFCSEAVDLDATAFSALLSHLREVDTHHTVIMIQVENETGIWGSPRDYCEAAQEVYHSVIPKKVADEFNVSGNWEEAFKFDAPGIFMAWALACAVEKIAGAGKKCLSLPMYMNCALGTYDISRLAGSWTAGGPMPMVQRMWRAFAPDIDFYAPDIYCDDFSSIAKAFAQKNPLFIPETGADKNAVSKFLYCTGQYNLLGFSPFGIDAACGCATIQDSLMDSNYAGLLHPGSLISNLNIAYRIAAILWPALEQAKKTNRVMGFYEQTPGDEFILDRYVINVTYNGTQYIPGDAPIFPAFPGDRSDFPKGGGLILQESDDTFLICAVSCNIRFQGRFGGQERLYILEKRELYPEGNELREGRILNGDEKNVMAFGPVPALQRIRFYRR